MTKVAIIASIALCTLAFGATKDVVLPQRDSPNSFEDITIPGASNPGKAIGFDDNGILGPISIFSETDFLNAVASLNLPESGSVGLIEEQTVSGKTFTASQQLVDKHGSAGVGSTETIDVSVPRHEIILNQHVEFDMIGWQTNQNETASIVKVIQGGAGGHTISFASGSAPTQTPAYSLVASEATYLVFISNDGGVTIDCLSSRISASDLPTTLTVDAQAYNATTWNNNFTVPTKNDLRQKIESMGSGSGLSDGDKGDITVSGSGTVWAIDDTDLIDLMDGSLTGSKVGTGISGDNVTSGTVADARIDAAITRDSEAAAAYQPLDTDLTDLADGTLTGSKVGTGVSGDNITSGTVAEARIDSTIARDSEGVGFTLMSGGDYTNATAVLSNVNNMAVSMAANEVWVIEWYCTCALSGAGETRFAVDIPTAATMEGYIDGADSNIRINTDATATISISNDANSGNHINMVITNGVNAGSAQLMARGDGTNTLTIRAAGTYMKAKRISP